SVATRSVNAIDANRGLFNYRPVRPIDTLLARTLLETIIYIIVYALLMLILAFLGENFSMSKLVLLFTTWLLLIIFSLGTGLIFMVLG
ncbi:ABC transporter permease, partial [Escherichia coli]|nr:ABC transporter permease [Escherichia coli]